MRIALAQYDFPVRDIAGNVRRIQTPAGFSMEFAAARSASIAYFQ